jgi:hypothetical protein
LNDIAKSMDKMETHISDVQNQMRSLLVSNRETAEDFIDIRRQMTNRLKKVAKRMERTPGIAHNLAAMTSETLTSIPSLFHFFVSSLLLARNQYNCKMHETSSKSHLFMILFVFQSSISRYVVP